jgi:hypothetical protein
MRPTDRPNADDDDDGDRHPQKLILYCIVPSCLNPTLPTSLKKDTLFTLVVLLSSKPSYFKISRLFVRLFVRSVELQTLIL